MTKISIEPDRVVSFSYKPHNRDAYKAVKYLKDRSKKTGVSFSFLVIKAISNYIDELNKELTDDK